MHESYPVILRKTVRSFKLKYHLTNPDADDLESVIVLHIAKISKDKRLDEELFLKTCIWNCARNWLKSYIVQANRRASLSDHHQLPAKLIDIDQHILLNEVLNALTPNQRTVICIFYGLGDDPPVTDFRYIAKQMNMERGSCRHLYDSAMAVMRRITR